MKALSLSEVFCWFTTLWGVLLHRADWSSPPAWSNRDQLQRIFNRDDFFWRWWFLFVISSLLLVAEAGSRRCNLFVLQARAAQLLTITAKHFLGRLPGRVLTWGGGDRRVGCHVRTQGKQNNAKQGGNVRDGEMSDSLWKDGGHWSLSSFPFSWKAWKYQPPQNTSWSSWNWGLAVTGESD